MTVLLCAVYMLLTVAAIVNSVLSFVSEGYRNAGLPRAADGRLVLP